VGSRVKLNVKRSLLPTGPIETQQIRFRAYLRGPDAIFAEPDPANISPA
jgi:hypothetical protein